MVRSHSQKFKSLRRFFPFRSGKERFYCKAPFFCDTIMHSHLSECPYDYITIYLLESQSHINYRQFEGLQN